MYYVVKRETEHTASDFWSIEHESHLAMITGINVDTILGFKKLEIEFDGVRITITPYIGGKEYTKNYYEYVDGWCIGSTYLCNHVSPPGEEE